MKKYFYILIFIFLSQCGYTALYDDKKSGDISITFLNMSGDNKMNSLIKSKLIHVLILNQFILIYFMKISNFH